MSNLCAHEQLSFDHIKAQVETQKEKPFSKGRQGSICDEREGDVCPTHVPVRSVSRWNLKKKSKQSPFKSTLRKKIQPLPRSRAPALSGGCCERAPVSADSVLSSFRGIFSHVSDDRCGFPALIGREELTSSCYVLNCLL